MSVTPASPNVTLTATLQSIAGAITSNSALKITLVGYGSTQPTIMGSAVLLPVTQNFKFTTSTLNIPIYGNDVISPSGTTYLVQYIDPNGNVVSANEYSLVGTGSLDLSVVQPYNATGGNPPQGIIYTLFARGLAGTVTVGTVTESAAGTPPTIINTGTEVDAVLNFTLPAGPTGGDGGPGPQGPPSLFSGAYSAATTYAAGQTVSFTDGSLYASLQNANTGNNPSSSPTFWGIQVPAGSPTVFTGNYNTATNYTTGQAAYFNGSSYVSLQGNNTNNQPDGSPAYWGLQAKQGAAGGFTASTTAPPNANSYPNLNPGNLADDTALNAGMLLYAGGYCFGMDLSGQTNNSQTGTRLFAPSNKNVVMAFHNGGTVPAQQSDFTNAFVLTPTQLGLFPNSSGAFAVTITSTGQITGGGLLTIPPGVPYNPNSYLNANPNGAADDSKLNGGVNLLPGGYNFGLDLGYGPNDSTNTRLYAPKQKSITMAFYDAGQGSPTSQAAFTTAMHLDPAKWTLFPDVNGNGKVQVDASGNLTLAGTLTTQTGLSNGSGTGFQTSDALKPNQAATLVQMQSTMATQPHGSFVVSYTGFAYRAFGDSMTAGSLASSAATCFVGLIGTAIGVSPTNYGVSGDQVVDCSWHMLQTENVSASTKVLYTLAIGFNDNGFQGTGAHEPVFQAVHLALTGWLATRGDNRVDGGTGSAANWTNDTYYPAVIGKQSSTQGASITYNLTTYGQPLYVWMRMADGNAGTYTVSIDGGAAQAYTSAGVGPLQTTNGNHNTAPQMLRFRVAPGAHTVTIAVTSATGAGSVSVLSVGTPSPHTYYTSPTVVVFGVTPYLGDLAKDGTENGYGSAQYTSLVQANVALLQGDGLDVRFADNRSAMQDGLASLYGDANTHPNDLGHAAIAAKVIPVIQQPPARYVARGTPLAGGKGTPGDVWSYGNMIYGVQGDQSIRFVATTGTV